MQIMFHSLITARYTYMYLIKQVIFTVTVPRFDSNNIMVWVGYVPGTKDFCSLGQEKIGQMAFGTLMWKSSRSAHKVKSFGLDFGDHADPGDRYCTEKKYLV